MKSASGYRKSYRCGSCKKIGHNARTCQNTSPKAQKPRNVNDGKHMNGGASHLSGMSSQQSGISTAYNLIEDKDLVQDNDLVEHNDSRDENDTQNGTTKNHPASTVTEEGTSQGDEKGELYNSEDLKVLWEMTVREDFESLKTSSESEGGGFFYTDKRTAFNKDFRAFSGKYFPHATPESVTQILEHLSEYDASPTFPGEIEASLSQIDVFIAHDRGILYVKDGNYAEARNASRVKHYLQSEKLFNKHTLGFALNQETPSETLTSLIDHPDPKVVGAVTSNPSISPETLEYIYKEKVLKADPDSKDKGAILLGIARNNSTPTDSLLLKVLNKAKEEHRNGVLNTEDFFTIQRAVAGNWKASESLRDSLARSKDQQTVQNVAMMTKNVQLFESFADSPNELIRYSLVFNYFIDESVARRVCEKLRNDTSEQVREAVEKRYPRQHFRTAPHDET